MDPEQTAPATLPQVLNRNIIPILTQGLDASDVLECYALIRKAPLHGLANSTIQVHKTLIGVRYRPTAASAFASPQQQAAKESVELTLEYGPQRLGPLLHHDAMPFVQVEDRSSVLSWDNVGKVYYTTKIVSEDYLSSYYMASMTGAVLDKLLIQAVEYAEVRKRYQPFAVYSSSGKELRSSSPSDFTEVMWQHMANVGVEIHPILPPPLYEARVWVSSWTKVVPEPHVAHEAATFYQKLYQCLESIATNDYSAYIPTPSPTMSPAPSSEPTSPPPTSEPSFLLPPPSSSPTESDAELTFPPTGNETEAMNDDGTVPPGNSTEAPLGDDWSDGTDKKNDGENSPGAEDDPKERSPFFGDGPRRTRGRRQYRRLSDVLGADDDDSANGETEAPSGNLDDDNTIAGSSPPTSHPTFDSTAASTEDPGTAAADAAHNAATQAAMEGLLSGDGSVMSSIVTTCFTDPQYEIATVDGNGTITSEAFLYRDGSHYFKLNLTNPYFEVAKVTRPLPTVTNLSEIGSGGDFVDWLLALLVLCSVGLMITVMLQQMGYHFVDSLFICQRWFFNPRKYDYEGNAVQTETVHHFGEDGIPLSMGGRLTTVSPIVQRRPQGDSALLADPDLHLPDLNAMAPSPLSGMEVVATVGRSLSRESSTSLGDLELSNLATKRRPLGAFHKKRSESESQVSMSDEEFGNDSVILPESLRRDPDMVEMPSLRSTSKVAVPAGASGTLS